MDERIQRRYCLNHGTWWKWYEGAMCPKCPKPKESVTIYLRR